MATFAKSALGLLALTSLVSAECYTFRARKSPMPGDDFELEASLWRGAWSDSDQLCKWEIPFDSDEGPYHPGACEDGYAALVTNDFNSMTATPEGQDPVTFEYNGQWERVGIFPPVYYDDVEVTNC